MAGASCSVDSSVCMARTATSVRDFDELGPVALNWTAHYEWLRIGHNRVRIYRLEAKLLDRHRVVVLVSRVGEILRVEFPGDIKLITDIHYAS